MMDDAELIERLRGWAKDIQEGSEAIWAMDQDLKGAADRIEALIALVTAQAARIEGLERDRDKDHRFIKELCSQIEQLNAKVADWSVRVEAERDAARDAALEEAAKIVEGDKCRTFGDAHRLAAAIRALKGKSHE